MIGWTTKVDRRTNETLLRVKKMETEPSMCGVINAETTKSVDRGQTTLPFLSLIRSVNLDWSSIDWHYLSRTWNSPLPVPTFSTLTSLAFPQTAFAVANQFFWTRFWWPFFSIHSHCFLSLVTKPDPLEFSIKDPDWPESWKPLKPYLFPYSDSRKRFLI